MAKLLEIVDLVANFYTYEGVVKALDRVSLTIDHGMTFGVVGESGCGKSVTVRSVMGIIQPPGKVEGGNVFFYPRPDRPAEAIDLLQQPERTLQGIRGNRISMIFQEPNAALNPIMSIGDQVAESFLFHRRKEMAEKIVAGQNTSRGWWGRLSKGEYAPFYRVLARSPDSSVFKFASRIPLLKRWDRPLRREARRRSVDLLKKLGIPNPEEMVGRYPHHLSGGMKQRIVIAIALACNPLLLIADEATSNLDVTIQAQILTLLRDLKQKEISSVLLITHDLGVVAETCDRVAVMYAGNLCEVADVEALFRSPKHPYTRALLESVPKLDHQGELQSIEGTVPNLVTPPPGCRFHPRCPHALPACRQHFPAMKEIKEGHLVACYLYTAQPRRQMAA